MAQIAADMDQHQTKMTEDEENNLKYLEFVQIATLHLLEYFSTAYDYAKDNSGPLKSGVQTLEGTVKTVVGPVYNKYHDVPLEFLKIMDRKVEFSVNEVERHVPSLVIQAISVAQKAPVTARSMATEVQRDGVVGSAKRVVKNAYTKYEPVAEVHAAMAWRKLNNLPLFPKVAQVVVPTAEYYNKAVSYTAEKGYTVSSYLPLLPTQKIANVFGGGKVDSATTTPVPVA